MRNPIIDLIPGDVILIRSQAEGAVPAEVIDNHWTGQPGFYAVWSDGREISPVYVTEEGQANLRQVAPDWAIRETTR